MLLRLKTECPNLVKDKFDKIPEQNIIYGKVLDPSMGGGQFMVEVEKKKRSAGLTDKQIRDTCFGYATGEMALNYAINKHKLVGNYKVGNFMEENPNINFATIITNPPYQGKAQLHQQFFNKALHYLEDGGYLVFIQPASPYFNKNAVRTHEKEMQKNICMYNTKVQIVDANVFKEASIANDIAITILKKELINNNCISSFTYKNNKIVKNVFLDDINFMGETSQMYKNIKNKYVKFIKENGSLRDLIYSSYNNPIVNLANLQRIRGHMYMKDFYTFVSNDSSYYTSSLDDKSDHGIKVNSMNELKNVYIYLKTFIARFGLSFRKINTNNQPSEFEMVPLVDLTKKWNDESLAELIGLTNKELNYIRKKLPDYHDLLA